MATKKAEEAPAPTLTWRGVEYNLSGYDEVRIWQDGKGEQHCWLSQGGKPLTRVPVDNHAEALLIDQQFVAARGRIHFHNYDEVKQRGLEPDPRLGR